ncbi:MAG: DUF1080 domain-containing protein [Halioglobus sp.]|nr:DUF1080 domain-containing protein [Halioglobus sp.]
MRTFIRIVLLLVVLLVFAAAYIYQTYIKVGDYSHSGAKANPPSESLAQDAQWLSLFDGESLEGWTPKLVGHPVGDNYLDTFRVEDGAITVSYDNYSTWNGEFGHLFYQTPFDRYILQLEYRFLGEQIAEGVAMAWAWRNSGVMLHSQSPSSMTLDQDFPVSLEAQLLGAPEDARRTTGNLCTPGTHVELQGDLHTMHCINSLVAGTIGDDWVQLELEVNGDDVIRHFINGELAIEYRRPRLDTGDADGGRLHQAGADIGLGSGYIALQSESHPVQFRNIRLHPLD